MRLDGWKAIGTHFGKERSTVIRWEAERGMPVHRIPGAGRGSVYALTEELDAWLAANEGSAVPLAQDGPSPDPEPSDPVRSRPYLRLLVIVIVLVGLVSLAAFALSYEGSPAGQTDLPQDPELASIYLEARSDWAQRSETSIWSAIEKLKHVTAADPGFSPAYAALADCYVLAREFGSMSDSEAFGKAQEAADAALRIDPDNPDALRALGFIEYWWRGNRAESRRRFAASLEAAPRAAQTHFWFGNILIDSGDFDAGLKELEQARLIEPASIPIQVDIAWAHYSKGEIALALSKLETLRQRDPELPTVRDYLSVVYLEQGNLAGFVEEYKAYARLRNLSVETAHAEMMETALEREPDTVLPLLLAQMEAEIADGNRSYLPWPVVIASAAGDRPATLRLLAKAAARNERWGSAWAMRNIATQWRGDAEITAQLERLRAPSMIAP